MCQSPDRHAATLSHALLSGSNELRRPACKAAVHRSIERGAEDIRFGARLGTACWEDRQNFCSSVPPGSARVIRCLQSRCVRLPHGAVPHVPTQCLQPLS